MLKDLVGLFQACPDFPECGLNVNCCSAKRTEQMKIEAQAMAAAAKPQGNQVASLNIDGFLESLGIPEQYRKPVMWGSIIALGLIVVPRLLPR